MKSYTDIEQSKVLTKILPLESADMVLPFRHPKNDEYIPGYVVSRNYVEVYNEMMNLSTMEKEDVCKLIQPSWSLTALLNVLPNNENISTNLSRGGYKISTPEYTNSWFVDYEDEANGLNNCVTSADNPVDACVTMIEKLNKLNLL